MTIKRRLAIYVSAAFLILFGVAIALVYLSFSSFRREEFSDRLEEKALTTVELLLKVREIDKQMLKIIDQNSINKLYNEKTLVFDENYRLIYSSIDDASIRWNHQDLVDLKKNKRFFRIVDEKDVLGIFYDFEAADYYVLIAAEDRYGNTKLRFLFYSLLTTFLVGIAIVWIATYFIIRRLTKPLDDFQARITQISANELSTQIPIDSSRNDEISLLARAFNQMLIRIEKAFSAQRAFTANASHELRTPISRITFQLDNLLESEGLSLATRQYLRSISGNVSQLSELIDSLLLLAKNSPVESNAQFKTERIDELIFVAYEQVRRSFPDFKMNFEIVENEELADGLEILAAKPVLEIAIANLLRNAYQYSPDNCATVLLEQTSADHLTLTVSNSGELLGEAETGTLFQPFTRGANARKTNGSGLGLSIVKRILDYHEATIRYMNESGEHRFIVTFKTLSKI
ncbi:HAMP domain-containing sensor histidine kinase [Persicitalea jodogahamensis]|uniref:histidine kinase n=1 Tax=Persicitalea jodogahamensis TaxID=402147 RepID=A0A8J3D7T4_9BACT|nr:ATP-binding protein [Persicitalea jodogahamensis]GHB65270.1 two-component sensor histidine kinase [Persicitalea jodogahamensis]